MALFGKKKEDKKTGSEINLEQEKASKKKTTVVTDEKDFSWVLKGPRVTEKASITPESVNAYVFEVHSNASSVDVKKAINEVYKVSPTKVNIVKIPSKKVTRQRRRGMKTGFKGGGKKAYVYLKKGERIEFV